MVVVNVTASCAGGRVWTELREKGCMNNRTRNICGLNAALVTVLMAGVPCQVEAIAQNEPQFYVAAAGDDRAPGTRAQPFATVARARDAVRALRASQREVAVPTVVEIGPGVYPIGETISFGPEDSGTWAAPIVYRAHTAGTAILSGARAVPLSEFKPITDPAIRARLDPAARQHVVALSLHEHKLRHGTTFPGVFSDSGGILALFAGGQRLPLARWPNEGHARMAEVLRIGDQHTPGIFAYLGDRPSRWLANPYIWLKGHWRVGWEDPAIRVAAIDPVARHITLAHGIALGIGSKYHRPNGSGEEPWWALNLLEEIDQPGEWAIDFGSGTLYLWPIDSAADAVVQIAQLRQPVVRLRSARHIQFQGLVVEYTLGDAFAIEDADGNHLAGCTVRRVSGRAVVLHGYRSSVRSCDIHDIGQGAILLSGGDLAQLTPSGLEVVNNHIHHYGQLKAQYSAAIHAGAFGEGAPNNNNQRPLVGARVAHNLIHHGPRDAILFGGAENVFEYNEIHSCGFASKDLGAFYSWLDWTIRGIVIRYNLIHRTVGGVNPDDGASGTLVYGNIFAGPRTGVWIASGPDHSIRHNLFIKERGAVFGVDARGVSRGYATNRRLLEGWQAVRPDALPWRRRFPQVATMLDDRPELPWRTEFVGNVVVTADPNPFQWSIGFDAAMQADSRLLLLAGNHITATDPGFVDPAQRDYSLRPESPVYRIIPDFPRIPFHRIGLQPDAHRPVLPDDAAAGRLPHQNPFADDDSTYFGT
jgi:hypothetical protein